jgi:virginiamycin B lyase
MFADRVGLGAFSNTAIAAAVTPSGVVKRVVLLAAMLTTLVTLLGGQSLSAIFTEYPIPTANSSPVGITAGPDGALWFTETNGQKIGRITTSGVITEYAVPTASANPQSITAGPDGALWFTELHGQKIGRITTSGVITEYSIPNLPAQPFGITTGPDGALWFADGGSVGGTSNTNRIGRITTSGVITEYFLPSATSGPDAITTGPDGALWFTEHGSTFKIGRITTSGVITEFPGVPSPPSGGITSGPDGALWFGTVANGVGRITTAGTISYGYYSLPTPGNSVGGITTWSDGALWFSDNGPGGTASKIGRLTTSGVITEYPLPNVTAVPTSITTGSDGSLWFIEAGSGKIGRLQVPPQKGVLSHIAAGGGWTTVITLVNTSSVAVAVTVVLHGDDGSALSLPVTTTQQGASQTTTTSSVTATINPRATLLLSMGDQVVSTVVGWADVLSAGSLGGYAIFRQTPQTGSPSEGTVPLQSQFPSTITLAYDNTAGFVMGVALANLSTSSAVFTATISDDQGNQLDQLETFTIPGSGHTSFVLPTQFPLTAGKRGIMIFQASGFVSPSGIFQAAGGIAGLGLRFSPFGTFTSVPTM